MRLVLNSLRTVLASAASYVFLALLAHGSAGAQTRKIELGDLQKIVDVSNPAISADGKSIVIIVSRAALEKQGFIDESRIAVSGWSYGGYMPSWLIGHYHIWKTAVSGAAVNSKPGQYNLSDYNVTARFVFGGSPWKKERAKAYEEQSPITYAAAITTPTLILHDSGDPRVPIATIALGLAAIGIYGLMSNSFRVAPPDGGSSTRCALPN
jgi:hypothetical protein